MNQEDHQGTKNNPDGGIKAENIFLIIYIFVLFFPLKFYINVFIPFEDTFTKFPVFSSQGNFFNLEIILKFSP